MPKLIKHDVVIDDVWTLLPATATATAIPAHGAVIVPLALWQAERARLLQRGEVGVWLTPADPPAALAEDLALLPLVAVEFPKFGDGRGFSTARLLRERHGFTGELRAFGDVFRDQLFYLRECGFDAFVVRAGLDPQRELAGLTAYDRVYASTTRTPQSRFAVRAGVPGDVWFPCA